MENRKVDYLQVFREIRKRKNLMLKNLVVAFILSCVWILPQPRFYECTEMLAPETDSEDVSGGLSGLASQFGFNIGGGGNDAIYPMLYPDLFCSPDFIVRLLTVNLDVPDEHGSLHRMDYYTHLTKNRKRNLLFLPFSKLVSFVKKIVSPMNSEDKRVEDVSKLNPFYLSKEDAKIIHAVSDFITCSVDKKTDVVTIKVKDQNAVVSAVMADSVSSHLQEFITAYRTKKARIDCEYYEKLVKQAKEEYDESIRAYSEFCDTHLNVLLQSYASDRDKLEGEMSIKMTTYQTMTAQLSAAYAKVQECTPVFTKLQTATVPTKPAGPKRMIFVSAMLSLTFCGTAVYILRDILKERIL